MSRSIHFVAHHDAEDAICRYRCFNFMSQLSAHGWKTGFTFLHGDGIVKIDADLVVLNRVIDSPRIRQFIEALKKRGSAVVCGLDDLVFDRDWVAKECAEATEAGASRKTDRVRRQVEGFETGLRATLLRSDCALVSTEYLASRVRQLGKPAFVLRNTLPDELWQLSADAATKSIHSANKTVLGYFSGTKTHRLDFQSISSALSKVLGACGDVELLVVGGLHIPDSLRQLGGSRIMERTPVPWRELPYLIRSVDVNLAPLNLEYEFNLGKSHLKWLEAAAVGIPTIASDTEEFRASIKNGVDGLIASSEQEWIEGMTELLQNKQRREAMGTAAEAKARTSFVGTAQAPQTVAIFEEMAKLFASSNTEGKVVLKRRTAGDRLVRSVRGSIGYALRAVRPKDKGKSS